MRIISTLILWVLTLSVSAQETSPFSKFGKITTEHLQKKIYAIDSNANAVVLSDIGETAIEGNSKGSFSIVFVRHRVVHILNKSGYDATNVEIPLYSNGSDEEKLGNIKAVTYNLENGKITETKLDKSSIFKEKVSKTLNLSKFTMPNVKEGSIIEYEYKVTSDYISNLDPWHFQENIPVIWSECKLSVPQFFTYAFLSHGYHAMHINDRKDKQSSFTVMDTRTTGSSDRTTFTSGVTDWRWVMANIPALKEESFTSALKNHLSSIEFQLASINYPLTPRDYRSSWPILIKELSESEYFGAHISKDNNWMSEEMKPLLAGATSSRDKAKRVFDYVRDNFSCMDYSSLRMSQTLKNVYKAKKGSVSDINIILTAMLRYAGLDARPVILSTTDHGYALEMYPMITSFNYVVTQLNDDGREYYLDASHSRLGFGKLLPECYNGHARVVDDNATSISLSADSLKEKKVTAVFISNDSKGKWIGSFNQNPGYYESYNIREKIKKSGSEEYFKEQQKEFGMDVVLFQTRIDSLDRLDEPVAIHYDLELKPEQADILYVNPLFNEAWKKNPFKAAERYYPVEMPYTSDETYLLTMEVPAGYVVDELPKQVIAKLDEQESGYFEYRITHSGTTISMRCRLKLTRTLFLPDEYETLREFFNLVVTKQNEQIVFKKKK